MKSICLSVAVLLCLHAQVFSQQAPKPPMGWNSYNCFGSAVHEDEVKANADYIAANLKKYGWQYIVVDFLWAYDNPPGSFIGNPYQKQLQDGSYIPWLAMDKWGRLVPHANKFPSAFGGKGFKPLSDYVHALGLQFGIHVMRGIPRQAVWARSPVLGAKGITADMIADTSSTCSWMNHMYGIDMSKPGAQEYLNSIVSLYKEWDVDFIKVDDISRPYHLKEIEGYEKAIANSGRNMVLSISPGETPVAQAAHVKQHTNMWRMADDFWDNWKMVLQMFNYAKSWEGVGGDGHWPDCDMIQIGKLSKRGPVGPERYSRFTTDELYTHMNFWCIFRSPLMLGGNQPENRELELKLFTNEEVIAVNQQGEKPRQLYKNDKSMVWVSNVSGSKDLYVGLFNIGEAAGEVTVDFAALGIKGAVTVRDLWQKTDIGAFKKQYKQTINPHGSTVAADREIKKLNSSPFLEVLPCLLLQYQTKSRTMKLSGNKILITGGASGIGLGLTERFIQENNTVIVVGRRESVLKEAAAKYPSVITKVCDLSTEAERVALYNWVAEKHPDLNVLINNAGIQQWMTITDDNFYQRAKEEISTNIEAPLHLMNLFSKLPALNAIMNVTSGLAFVPFTKVPVYSATKAFFHSFTMSAQYLLKQKNIEVIEIIPPALNTDLGGKGLHDFAQPVSDFINAIFEQLKAGKTELAFAFAEAMTQAGPEEIKAAFNRLNP